MKKLLLGCLASICVLILPMTALAQNDWGEMAATLEVIAPGVEVNRVNTVNWIPVNNEAIVGVGDVIRTDATGQARITFFADGVETELQPDTEYRIDTFEGNGDSFNLSASVLLGQTVQRINRLLDADSNYDLFTPGMELTVRGTEFVVRVEQDGRSAALVTEGTTYAETSEENAEVPTSYGIRSIDGGKLSDVVLASDFDNLDSSLDGCPVEVRTLDDVQLNVRLGPSMDYSRVGTIASADIDTFMGVKDSGDWYRIDFRGGFGWVMSTDSTVDLTCAGLRVFPANHIEDPTLYGSLGETIDINSLDVAAPTLPAVATEEATEETSE